MDLVAGDATEILMVIGLDDLAALDDARRFTAHLALGSGLDPTWLDLFAEAARSVTGVVGAGRLHRRPARARRPGRRRRTDDRAGRSRLDQHRRPHPGPRPGGHRRSLDRPGRGRARRAAARGEAVDPRSRGPARGVLPGRRSRAGRHLRLVAPLSDDDPPATRRRSRPTRPLWDAWTAVHATGDFYDLEAFRAGGVRLRPYEIELVGDVDRQVAAPPPVPLRHRHAVLGAARGAGDRRRLLAGGDRAGPDARRRPRVPVGALRPVEPVRPAGRARRRVRRRLHLARRARLAAGHRAAGPGSSPTSWRPAARSSSPRSTRSSRRCADEGVGPGELRLAYPYWEHEAPLTFEVQGSYADRTADVGDHTEHGWDHGLGEIVTALIDAGLRIETLDRASVPGLGAPVPRRRRGGHVAPASRTPRASSR